jgi:predicted TIM-barrel fold metal-dependent hydrolase
MMQKIIDRHGADRILFASDLPWDSPDRIRQKILRLKLSDDAKEKILGANAQRLLGLT